MIERTVTSTSRLLRHRNHVIGCIRHGVEQAALGKRVAIDEGHSTSQHA